MQINNMMLVVEGEDPTAAEPVLVHCDAEGSCLLVTVEKGEQKGNIFLWRDGDGNVWGRITTAGGNENGNLGKEINLFAEDAEQPQGAVGAPVAEEEPTSNEETGAAVEGMAVSEVDNLPVQQIQPEQEGIPDGVEIPF
jgi:hypothetical protein